MKAHIYWMQGWRNAPPRALRNAFAWKQVKGLEVTQWDDTNQGILLPRGYKWHPAVGPAMKADIILALAQERFGGLALGADMAPLRPYAMLEFAADLSVRSSGKGWVVWQSRQERPYNGGSWFPRGNEWIRRVCDEHRSTLAKFALHGPDPKKMALVTTGPEMWHRLIDHHQLMWERSVEVLSGASVFLYEPRHQHIQSKEAWLDAGFTGDWNGTKTDAWL